MRCGLASALTALAISALAPAAFANDSTAELTTGGLVLSKNADIEMRSEDLAISEKEISVRYRFFNRAASEKTVTVAFPMPDVTFPDIDTSFAFPEPESNNFLQFHTSVDGRDVHTYYEEKAISNGVDISARLKALGLPLAPQREATYKALDALPRATQDELVKLGFAIPNDSYLGKAVEHHVVPSWTFKSTFFWDQTFPAGRQIVVEHRYKPSLGETVGTMLGRKDIDPTQLRDYETPLLRRQGFPRRSECGAPEAGRERNRGESVLRAADRLCAENGGQLGRPDPRLSSDGRQGRGGRPRQLLRRRRQEDRADAVRGEAREFYADPRPAYSDIVSAENLRSWPGPRALMVLSLRATS